MDKTKYENVAKRVHTRKLDRMVARNEMRRQGLSKVTDRKHNRWHTKKDKNHGRECKRDPQSYFAQHWREWIA